MQHEPFIEQSPIYFGDGELHIRVCEAAVLPVCAFAISEVIAVLGSVLFRVVKPLYFVMGLSAQISFRAF
jgi:hypothetical protein